MHRTWRAALGHVLLASPCLAAEPSPEVSSAPASAPEPVEVTVLGARSEAQRLQESAEAVTVVHTHRAKRETADLGEVLARSQGVAVRREGGLGSGLRLALNGLQGDQVRLFLDGIPLDIAGYPFGLANVPVNLIERVEVYRGVVPLRFGADALGGAIHLVSNEGYSTRLGASYQAGSFGTHRVTLDGGYRDESSGFVLRSALHADVAQNNYHIDVRIADERGRPRPVRVPRFHDAYRAAGATLEAGFVEKPWASRVTIQGYASAFHKELQHNSVMEVPYGEVTYGEQIYGLTARYEVMPAEDFTLQLVANYSQRWMDFSDEGLWHYSWTGARIRYRSLLGSPRPGEIDGNAEDQTIRQSTAFARALAEWRPAPGHALRASVTPQLTSRTGEDRIQEAPAARDPLTAQRDLFVLVSGLEYELTAARDRLAAVVFLKDYFYRADTEEPLPGGLFLAAEKESHSRGFGSSLRVRLTPWMYAKASYEYSTRLPRPDEVFGNGALVAPNLELVPEVSHNANAGPRVELRDASLGDVVIDVNGFLRSSDDLIVLLGNDENFIHENVYAARALGVENAVSWASPRRSFALEGTLTWQDVRNLSGHGAFALFEGDRVPNRPYLFASFGGRLRLREMPDAEDSVEPYYNARYVHEFYRGWESQGAARYKQTVDSQLSHSAGVSWTVRRSPARVTSTLEVDNFTNAKLFDNYGVQRPGRAIYLKVAADVE